MKAGHELHVHRYAKQYNLEHEIYKAYLSSSRSTGRNHMFPYFWNVAETCNSMFPLCLRKSGPVPLYTQQRKREKTSRNR